MENNNENINNLTANGNDGKEILTFSLEDSIEASILHDSEGNIIDVNKKACKITGFSKEELIQQNLYEISQNYQENQILEDLKSHNSFPEFITTIITDENIKIVKESCLINIKGQKCILSVIHDITNLINVQRLLIEKELKYRALFDLNSDYSCFFDPEGKIIDANQAVLNDFNFNLEDIQGLTLSNLGLFHPEDESSQIIKKWIKDKKAISPLNNGKPLISRFLDRNGKTIWCQTYLMPVIIEGNLIGYQGISSDISEIKKAKIKLKKSLMEKELLLREIHHRVKNNMQIMSSLINMETQYIKDEKTLSTLKDSQNRIRSMSMVHEKLYQSQDLTRINVKDYIHSFLNDLFYSYNIPSSLIQLIVDVDDVNLNIETAMPCGLILCELVTNSLKYAFPDGRKGQVKVSFKLNDDRIHMTISDNGIGLPDRDYLKRDTLGLQLVKSLTGQLDGKLELDLLEGTEFRIIFKEAPYPTRIQKTVHS